MATDGLSLFATIHELQSLTDSRIDKIQEPDKDMLILHLHGPSCGRVKLMINIHNENGRIQLTSQVFENPSVPPSFCMILRKYLTGARIAGISQFGMDRIVTIDFHNKNELKDEISLQLIVELMGKHGNVFLVDSNQKILDCMRHFGLNEESIRICLPNCQYQEPPLQSGRLYPFSLNEAQFTALANGRQPYEWIQTTLLGISKLCSQQICSFSAPPSAIGSECYNVFSSLFHLSFSPSVIPDRGVLPFAPKNSAFIGFSSMCEAQEAFYRLKDEKAVLTKKRSAIRSCADHALKRVVHKLETQSFHLGNEETANQYRKYGELLLANLSSLIKSGDSVAVTDYYSEPPALINIPVDRALSLKQNADLYFKRYHKAKTAREYALTQIDSLTMEQDYLEGVLVAIEQCSSSDELSEIKEELISQGYLKAEILQKTKSKPISSEPYKYHSPSGSVMLVGKNNYQNDRLFRTESPGYYWFHVKDSPGSHVYLEDQSPTAEAILFAAQVAALHSKSSASANVAVDYTLRKYVKKPSGSHPGYVTYSNQHTVYVTPDAEALQHYRYLTEGDKK